MKLNKLTTLISITLIVFVSILGFGKQIKVLRIYSGGEVINEHKLSEIDYVEIQDIEIEENVDGEGYINGYKYVDLGLPSGLKWAACNVGASSPEEYGDYFAWGETTPKSTYTESNSATYNKEVGEISGNPEYDAASANWGGTWRIPSQIEMQELIDNCTWTWTTKNGIQGSLVSGPNGNSIFLPAAGYHGSSLNFRGSDGCYWSSTPSGSQGAYLYFRMDSPRITDIMRSYGQSIRAVSE